MNNQYILQQLRKDMMSKASYLENIRGLIAENKFLLKQEQTDYVKDLLTRNEMQLAGYILPWAFVGINICIFIIVLLT